MPSAHREAVRDFATEDQDTRMDIGRQVGERRNKLGLTLAQFAEAAKVTEMSLQLLEEGGVFEDEHNTVVAVLKALAIMESWRDGHRHCQMAQIEIERI